MTEISKAYEPQSVEDRWYDFWLKQGCFTADPARVSAQRPAYSIVIPPPNVTGMLHMGHVLNNTIQDILSRKARMDGKEVLWLPGTDHAGIATQVQVEKALKKEEKKSKHDLGREEFLKRVWVWKEKHGGIIINQLKKLGCSCDWTRERFTMDPEYSRCVQKVFVDLYKKGLIYRGKRMVNWCPASQTALSDEEVEMKPQKGFMYHFKVEVAEAAGSAGGPPASSASPNPPFADTAARPGPDGKIWLTIATTRPETIPGDTAVAVNPKDPRYAHLIGKHIVRPLPIQLPPEQKLIPIIGDEHVDFAFGTGVLKVTPAHDKADFDIGQRHKLPVVDIMNANGTMNELAGESLAGLDRFEARAVAVERLKELGVLVEEKPYENNVGFSQRADVPIEPRLSEQWFLKYPSVDASTNCVAEGQVKFHPDRWGKVYDHWLTNIQDWCISRQLWWGHRIPAWHKFHFLGDTYAQETVVSVDPPDNSGQWTQDIDVLDTWFSSWLWPFATMGWTGDKAHDATVPTLRAFYPTTDLVTGPDIIFFWVARMIMAGYEFMGVLPFRNVYFTGIIRDKQGRKMSKTLGNSPDPLVLIAKYGADALRFGTMRSAPLGQDVLFDEKDVELGRNFCNKLWNACRFRQMQGSAGASPASEGDSPEQFPVEGEINPALLTSDDQWILLRLDQAIREVSDALATYNFSTAVQALYRFFWSEYCDWYVEASKAALRPVDGLKNEELKSAEGPVASTLQPFIPSSSPVLRANKLAVIDFVLGHTLRMFHPFLPFITEELWHGMGFSRDLPDQQGGQTIMFAPWPKPLTADEKEYFGLDDTAEKVATAKYELVSLGRNLRRDAKLDPAKKLKFVLKPAGDLPAAEIEVLKILLNAETIEVARDYAPPKGTPSANNALGELFLPLAGLIDFAAERLRLTKEVERITAEITKVADKLANPNFAQKVPAKVLDEHRQRLADWQSKLAQVQSSLAAFGT
ncbi:valine--tRNA ligase [Verrucomicrobiota bacterium]|nr:valine--tRNA ligase [Verrucomicrobiota bacterium]